MPADSQGGEHNHKDYGQNILDNQHPENQAGELLLPQAHIVKSLENDGGR